MDEIKDNVNVEVKEDVVKNQIRCLIANVYDLQKMRISAGNRLVSSFYIQMGVKPSTSPDSADKEERKLIDKLKKEYSRISDALAENDVSVKKQIKALSEEKENPLVYIRGEIDYKLVDSYMLLLKSEEEATKVLSKYVESHPLWDAFFKNIKGCGTLMSAVCIGYLDIYRARHVSSFFKYCGLDTVQNVDEHGNKLFLIMEEGKVGVVVRQKIVYTYQADGELYTGSTIHTGEYDAEGNEVITTGTGELLDSEFAMRDGEFVYENIETGEEYVGEVVADCHGRRKGDTEMYEYVDKNGNKAVKRGLTYNPIVKTKLMGVLTGCLLKAKDPVYSKIYYDYRMRLGNSSRYDKYTDGHKNMMAQRYMVKQFLRNLWTTWRHLEGLPIDEPYEVAKLGNAPHKYNRYQVDMARKYASDFHPSY